MNFQIDASFSDLRIYNSAKTLSDIEKIKNAIRNFIKFKYN